MSNVFEAPPKLDLHARRVLRIELPQFLVTALELHVAEANDGAGEAELCTLEEYIESELVNLITLRDVADLERARPGFAAAVQQWLREL